MKAILLAAFNTLLLAFSVSTDDFFLALSYGTSSPNMSDHIKRHICLILSALQFLGVLVGWLVTDVLELVFHPFINAVPFILLIFLSLVGIKLVIEGIYLRNHQIKHILDLSVKSIFLHGLTTSMDAFSIGISLAGTPVVEVILLSVMVFFMTAIRCKSGLKFGKRINSKLPFSTGIISGIIIILVAIEIFVRQIL